MKTIDFYFDFISPYAYLAFEQLPKALSSHSYTVRYIPIMFGGLLVEHGQLGPAEIAPKREWTYRQVLWQAHQMGIDFKMPHSHPFNPTSLLRLSLACAPQGLPNRYVVETIFKYIWTNGLEATDAGRLDQLIEQLQPAADLNSPEIKNRLKELGQTALQHQLFGVPSFVVDDKVFWGLDSLPMIDAYLKGDEWFEQDHWDSVKKPVYGIAKRSPSLPKN